MDKCVADVAGRDCRSCSERSPRRIRRPVKRRSSPSGSLKRSCSFARRRKSAKQYDQAGFDQLSQRERSLHAKAFCTNADDPRYRELADVTYRDGDVDRPRASAQGRRAPPVPQGRRNGELPTVSWVVPPERFSDHPCSAWYGAWYIAELLDILTRNPEVWKKTIFILTYDENDGYFDHVRRSCAPHPRRPETGRVSAGIDAGLEYVERRRRSSSERRPAKCATARSAWAIACR